MESTMPRPIRFVPPLSVIEVTTRTVHGRLLLRPSRATNETILGIVGRAQELTGMTVHYVVVLSNHVHFLLRPRNALQLARFMAMVNANIAREVGKLVGWREKFWSRRFQAILISDEPAAQLGRLRYLLAQGVKEGLVEHPCAWPGVTAAPHLLEGRPLVGTWIDRTGLFNARQRCRASDPPVDPAAFRTSYELSISPLPCLEHLPAHQHRDFLEQVAAGIVEECRLERKAARKTVLGAVRVCRQNPHQVPNVAESPAPAFHAASRSVRLALRQAYAEFLAAFRSAAALLRAGLQAVFPEGSFPPSMPFVDHAVAT
jgi:hypothetical protein